MAVVSGTVALNASTPTPICTMGQNGALVYTAAAAGVVVIGGVNVTATGATAGVPLPSAQCVQVPGSAARDLPLIGAGQDTATLYGIATTGTPSISYITAASGGG
jgi:hypothetical protein